MAGLIEDEDGAPYPEVWAVYDPNHDPILYLPYPGGRGTGSAEAAEATAIPNSHLGWRAVRCQLVPVDSRMRECEGRNSNICVGTGCIGEECAT